MSQAVEQSSAIVLITDGEDHDSYPLDAARAAVEAIVAADARLQVTEDKLETVRKQIGEAEAMGAKLLIDPSLSREPPPSTGAIGYTLPVESAAMRAPA